MKMAWNVSSMRWWIRNTACGTAAVFFYSNVIAPPFAQANFWEERRRAVDTRVGTRVGSGPSKTNPTWDLLAHLPNPQAHLRTLTSTNPSPPPRGGERTGSTPFPSPLVVGGGRSSGPPTGMSVRGGTWNEGRVRGDVVRRQLAENPPLPHWIHELTAPYGTLREVWLPTERPGRLILYLQDAHDHLEAQQNLAGLIEAFSPHGLRFVGLEGAKGPVDFAPYRAFPNPQVTKELAAHFLKIRWLSGPEYAGLTLKQPPRFVGLEDAELYRAHVVAYRDAYTAAQAATLLHQRLTKRTEALKRQLYPPRLAALDATITKYHQGTLPLTEYVRALVPERTSPSSPLPQAGSTKSFRAQLVSNAAKGPSLNEGGRDDQPGLPPEYYPQLARFLEALTIERSLDFAAVERERRQVIEALAAKNTRQGLDDLTQLSVAFRLGQVSAGTYYATLRKFCDTHGVSLQRFPQFDRYIHYTLLVDQIQHEPLFGELQRLEEERVGIWLTTSTLRQLHAASRDLLLVSKLLTQTLTSQEWERYAQRRADILALSDHLAALTKAHPLPPGEREQVGSLLFPCPSGGEGRVRGNSWSDLLTRCESFYRLAFQRNEVLVHNLLTKLEERQDSVPSPLAGEGSLTRRTGAPSQRWAPGRANKPDRAQARPRVGERPGTRGAERARPGRLAQRGGGEGDPQIAVLVAGGFHTEGLTQLFKQHRLAYAVITPRITKIEGKHDYLEVFRRDKTPLEKLFSGERLTIQVPGGIAGFRNATDLPRRIPISVLNTYVSVAQVATVMAAEKHTRSPRQGSHLQLALKASKALDVTYHTLRQPPDPLITGEVTSSENPPKTIRIPFTTSLTSVDTPASPERHRSGTLNASPSVIIGPYRLSITFTEAPLGRQTAPQMNQISKRRVHVVSLAAGVLLVLQVWMAPSILLASGAPSALLTHVLAFGFVNPRPSLLPGRRVQKALGLSRVPKGSLLFWPRRDFMSEKPLGKIRTRFTAEQALAKLREAKERNTELAIEGHLRGLDGPGSSLDLPEFQKTLTVPGAKGLKEFPSTPTIASDFKVKIRFELADDPEAIEYLAPDYHITPDSPYHRLKGDVQLTTQGRTPNGQKDAPAYIFRNLFGLRGVKIILEEINPMALAGGMESSNVFNVALIAGASMLSGADLSQAEIFNLAVKLENEEFGGLTGGQGHLATLLGGAYRHVWLSGIRDKGGSLPYGALSIPLLPAERFPDIEKHLMLVQAGKKYKKGKAVEGRTASLINNMWTDLLRDKDEVGFPLHLEKLGLTDKYTQGLANGDYQAVVEVINRYVDIRDELTKRWLNLMLEAHEDYQAYQANQKKRNRTPIAGHSAYYQRKNPKGTIPGYAYQYADKVFNPEHRDREEYKDYKAVRDLYHEYEQQFKKKDKKGDKQKALQQLRETSLYTLDPIRSLVEAARAEGIAIMPLGAGGPGANLIAVSPKGIRHLTKFLKSRRLDKLTKAKAAKIVRGTGTLKGYMPFRVGREPMQFHGFSELGFSLPETPHVVGQPSGRQRKGRLPNASPSAGPGGNAAMVLPLSLSLAYDPASAAAFLSLGEVALAGLAMGFVLLTVMGLFWAHSWMSQTSNRRVKLLLLAASVLIVLLVWMVPSVLLAAAAPSALFTPSLTFGSVEPPSPSPPLPADDPLAGTYKRAYDRVKSVTAALTDRYPTGIFVDDAKGASDAGTTADATQVNSVALGEDAKGASDALQIQISLPSVVLQHPALLELELVYRLHLWARWTDPVRGPPQKVDQFIALLNAEMHRLEAFREMEDRKAQAEILLALHQNSQTSTPLGSSMTFLDHQLRRYLIQSLRTETDVDQLIQELQMLRGPPQLLDEMTTAKASLTSVTHDPFSLAFERLEILVKTPGIPSESTHIVEAYSTLAALGISPLLSESTHIGEADNISQRALLRFGVRVERILARHRLPIFTADVDGAIRESRGTISDENAAAIARILKAGGWFVLLTTSEWYSKKVPGDIKSGVALPIRDRLKNDLPNNQLEQTLALAHLLSFTSGGTAWYWVDLKTGDFPPKAVGELLLAYLLGDYDIDKGLPQVRRILKTILPIVIQGTVPTHIQTEAVEQTMEMIRGLKDDDPPREGGLPGKTRLEKLVEIYSSVTRTLLTPDTLRAKGEKKLLNLVKNALQTFVNQPIQPLDPDIPKGQQKGQQMDELIEKRGGEGGDPQPEEIVGISLIPSGRNFLDSADQSIPLKAEKDAYDPTTTKVKRFLWSKVLNGLFDHYGVNAEATPGGTTSINIMLTGWNKGKAIHEIPKVLQTMNDQLRQRYTPESAFPDTPSDLDSFIYLGDELEEGGTDHSILPYVDIILNVGKEKNVTSPRETGVVIYDKDLTNFGEAVENGKKTDKYRDDGARAYLELYAGIVERNQALFKPKPPTPKPPTPKQPTSVFWLSLSLAAEVPAAFTWGLFFMALLGSMALLHYRRSAGLSMHALVNHISTGFRGPSLVPGTTPYGHPSEGVHRTPSYPTGRPLPRRERRVSDVALASSFVLVPRPLRYVAIGAGIVGLLSLAIGLGLMDVVRASSLPFSLDWLGHFLPTLHGFALPLLGVDQPTPDPQREREALYEQLETGVRAYLQDTVNRKLMKEEDAALTLENTLRNFKQWWEDPHLDDYTKRGMTKAVAQGRFQAICAAFSSAVVFGTGGIRKEVALSDEDLREFHERGFRAEILKGPGTVNNITLARITLGVARYFKAKHEKPSVAIAYDTRIQGKAIAELVASLYLKEGFTVHLFKKVTPMPKMSFAVADLRLDFGSLVSASHNASPFNGYKVSNKRGAQLAPDERKVILEYIYGSQDGSIREVTTADIMEFLIHSVSLLPGESLLDHYATPQKLKYLDHQTFVDAHGFHHLDFKTRHLTQMKTQLENPAAFRKNLPLLQIGYSAFYGAGAEEFPEIMAFFGLPEENLRVVSEYNRPDGFFPRFSAAKDPETGGLLIPDPGNPLSWTLIIEDLIQQYEGDIPKALQGLDLLIGTDPDADRAGIVIPIPEYALPTAPEDFASQQIVYVVPEQHRKALGFAGLKLVTANDAWTLIAKVKIDRMSERGTLKKGDKYNLVKTHVTTDALKRIAAYARKRYGVVIHVREPFVGFSLVAEEIIRGWGEGETNLGGYEESNGFSWGGAPARRQEDRLGSGGHTLEKDGLLAAVLMAEIAADAKTHGKTLYQFLNDEVYLNPAIGYFATTPHALEFENSPVGQGMKIQTIQNVLDLARRVVKGEEVTIAGQRVQGVTTFLPRHQKYANPRDFPVDNYHDLLGTLSDGSLQKDPSKIPSFFPEEGVRFFFDTPKTGVHHLTIRPSGTENKLRFYVQWTAGKGLSRDTVVARGLQIDRMVRSIALDAQQLVKGKTPDQDRGKAMQGLGLFALPVSEVPLISLWGFLMNPSWLSVGGIMGLAFFLVAILRKRPPFLRPMVLMQRTRERAGKDHLVVPGEPGTHASSGEARRGSVVDEIAQLERRGRQIAALFPRLEGDLLNKELGVKPSDILEARQYVDRLLGPEVREESVLNPAQEGDTVRQQAKVRAQELLTASLSDDATQVQAAVLTLEAAAGLENLGQEEMIAGVQALRKVLRPFPTVVAPLEERVWKASSQLTEALRNQPTEPGGTHKRDVEWILNEPREEHRVLLHVVDVSNLSPVTLDKLLELLQLDLERFFVMLATRADTMDLAALKVQLAHRANARGLSIDVEALFKERIRPSHLITRQTLLPAVVQRQQASQFTLDPAVKLDPMLVQEVGERVIQQHLAASQPSLAIQTHIWTDNAFRWILTQLVTILTDTGELHVDQGMERAQQAALLPLKHL